MSVKQEWPGRRGAPDRLFLLNGGRTFMIEFKTPTGKLTSNQDRTIKLLVANGYPVYIVNDVETGKRLVDLYAEPESIT